MSSDLTPHDVATVAQLSEWRNSDKSLTESDLRFLTDAQLARYVVAHSGCSFADAKKRLLATLEWRATSLAPVPTCQLCIDKVTNHCFFNIGVTAAGMPIIYSCVPRAESYAVAETVREHACVVAVVPMSVPITVSCGLARRCPGPAAMQQSAAVRWCAGC